MSTTERIVQTKKITFDLKEFKEFIESLSEERHCGKCGEVDFGHYKLLDDGKVVLRWETEGHDFKKGDVDAGLKGIISGTEEK